MNVNFEKSFFFEESKMSERLCTICQIGEVVEDKRMAGMLCMNCGECFELGAFTEDVAFKEDERGRYKAVGATYNMERGCFTSRYEFLLISF